ncbi:hypothetical protein PAECIP111891_00476 [Paenibacillus allorhizoplanae]|uniref:Probable pectate lyase C n=1 Tax=Paenibacillus allorhizoplanae TaxID=2905648 RepID=A0ABM9BR61_9BACL|nr:discoidin domain-containing protein [Paenibacillus allorhizoplanae]CAH1193023.1 hypothetical protein PAECIP111891_00476 [Paenibacillus allorhizoplanae]
MSTTRMLQIEKCLISRVLVSTIFVVLFTMMFLIPRTNAASTNYTLTSELINGVTYSVITVSYSGDDAGPAVNEAIAAAKTATKPVILDFPAATYHFKDSSAIDAQYYISNTTNAAKAPGGWRKVGLLFKDISDLTIRGNGSSLMFHGVVTPIVFDHAVNVKMNNISFDFKRPVMSEITVAAVGNNYIDMNIHPDSLYKVVNNQLQWTGEVDSNGNAIDNWVARGYANVTQTQEYDPISKKTWRVWNALGNPSSVQDLGNRKVRFTYTSAPNVTVGHTYQIRNDSRKEEGAFIYRSKDITWTGVNFYAAPGLGIVGQYSENLNFEQLNFAPKTGSGRTNASMADFMQISGCKGQITVNNSHFFGAHDDPINVHGTHLQIVDKPSSNQIKVQFKHNESWGFDAFAVGDKIDYIKGSNLLANGSAIVTGVTRVDDYNILLTLDQDVPSSISVNTYFVENATWNPDVTITNSTFESIPTRGILVTTRGNVLIDHNTFNRTEMSAILIADDANSWFESGMVRNVTISNNTFNNPGNSVISIEPSASSTNPDQTVHSNISINNNTFYMTGGTTSIYAGSVNGFNFTNNKFQEGGLSLTAKGSKAVTISGTTFGESGITKSITLSNMYTNTDTIDPSQGFTVTRTNNYVPLGSSPNDIPQSQITATATSQHSGNEASEAFDGESSTFWHSEWAPMAYLPQSITLNLGGSYTISKLRYLPRQDGTANGNITGYTISTSTDGVSFTNMKSGTWADDASEKTATISPVSAKYVRLTATSGHGGFASISELNIERADIKLISITAPANLTGVANGTAKSAAALGLPSTVELVTDSGSKTANVTWNVDAANYDPAVMAAQTFTVNGTVTLPAGVVNPNNVALTTSISVNVLPTALLPKSTLTGLQEITVGQTFDVTMGLSNVTQSVYQQLKAQDLTLNYDPTKLQFESVTSVKDGFQVYQREITPGQIRIVAASVGANVSSQGDILSFKFTAKSLSQTSNTTISVGSVLIANGQGNELQIGGASNELQIRIPSTPVDKSLLNASIASAQTKYTAAVEGSEDGLYVIGSKAQLQSAIDTARVTANNLNATQQQVDSAKTALEAAIQVFESKKITANVNGDRSISIGDLAIVAGIFGTERGQAGWNEKADVNHDGKVDIVDLAIVAKAILQ